MTTPIQTEEITLRAELSQFAIDMERLLRQNDWKGGWQNETMTYLVAQYLRKSNELVSCIDYLSLSNTDVAHDIAIEEATHTANFLMMIADNLRRKKEELHDGAI